MIDLGSHTTDASAAPRRGLFSRLAAATALGLAGLLPAPRTAQADTHQDNGPNWPPKLRARHRQVVDAIEVNSGFPLAFAYSFVAPNAPGTATAVVVLRHMALTLAMNNAIWEKYKIGETFKLFDPETKALATKNPFLHPKPGVLATDEMAIDRLLLKGTVFGACNMALMFLSKRLAASAGVSADDAVKEWSANVIPGITLIPSGTWGVNRAQEAGCTYCAGG